VYLYAWKQGDFRNSVEVLGSEVEGTASAKLTQI
jgi:hypothetical protein